jgi:DNA-binding CsgD family transcriptional regulator
MFDGYATLSPAELRLFDHMREKEFNRESAAHAMGISIKTADIHWTNIRKKLSTGLNIVSSSQVVYFAALFDVTTAVSVETAIGEAEEGS